MREKAKGSGASGIVNIRLDKRLDAKERPKDTADEGQVCEG